MLLLLLLCAGLLIARGALPSSIVLFACASGVVSGAGGL
jgi:hypothetical protein